VLKKVYHRRRRFARFREYITGSLEESALPGRRFFLLFLLLLTTLILYPYAEATVFGYYAFRVIGSSAILISVYAANLRRSLLIFAGVLAVPALIQHMLLSRAHASSFGIVNMVLSFIFDVVVVAMIFRHVFAREQVNSETVFGALCIYLLVGFSFASVYHMVRPSSRARFISTHIPTFTRFPTRFDFIYYSFGTMTSLGAAGITPVSAHARAIPVLEAILGVLYLAVLVARLIRAYRAGSKL
jgi:Ion channel